MAFTDSLAYFNDLNIKLERERSEAPTFRVNKHYFRLYRTGFLITQVVILIGIVYILLVKPLTISPTATTI
jgi:hypothetical protein